EVQATCAEGWRGDVDHVVRGRLQLARGGAHGDVLADAYFAGDDPEQRLADAKADARDDLLVAGAIAQLLGGAGVGGRRTREAEVGDPGCAAHRWTSDAVDVRSRYAMWPSNCSSCAATTMPR